LGGWGIGNPRPQYPTLQDPARQPLRCVEADSRPAKRRQDGRKPPVLRVFRGERSPAGGPPAKRCIRRTGPARPADRRTRRRAATARRIPAAETAASA